MLQPGIMRRTLTSFGCPCQQHYCLQPLAKKIRTANLTQQHFRELEPRKMGLTAVNPQEELWKNHTKHLHHTLTLCCACRASHITVHVLPSGSLRLRHSVGAEGPLRTAAPWHLVHTCKSKCPWAALCPAQPSRGQQWAALLYQFPWKWQPEQLVSTKILLKHNFVPSGLFCYLFSHSSFSTMQYTDQVGLILMSWIC